MTTGDRIRISRRQKNMTQDELALAVGVSKPTINKYESGKIRTIKRPTIAALAKALEVSPGYLMGWEDENGKAIAIVEPAQREALAVDAVEQELLRIFRTLPVRSRVELLSKAYELEGNK